MRLLLDENLPKRLKQDFPEHEIFTVRDKQWNGIKNGELLKLLVDNSFDVQNLHMNERRGRYIKDVFGKIKSRFFQLV